MSKGDRNYKPSKASKPFDREPYPTRAKKNDADIYLLHHDSGYEGTVTEIPINTEERVERFHHIQEADREDDSESEALQSQQIEQTEEAKPDIMSQENELAQVMKMILEDRQERKRREECRETERQHQHADLIKTLTSPRGDTATASGLPATLTPATPRYQLPHMAESDDVEEFILQLELEFTLQNIPRREWKRILVNSITMPHRMAARHVYPLDDSTYEEVKASILGSTGNNAYSAADRFFSIDLDGLLSTNPAKVTTTGGKYHRGGTVTQRSAGGYCYGEDQIGLICRRKGFPRGDEAYFYH